MKLKAISGRQISAASAESLGSATVARNDSQYLHLSDIEIWQKFKQGDESAFIHIYSTYFDQLYYYGTQFTPDIRLVEDAIQDLFILLSDQRAKLSVTSSIKFYLFKSLKRRIVANLKKKSKFIDTDNIDKYADFAVSYSMEKRMIDSQFDKERRIKLAKGLKSLTSRKREAIYYFYYENLSYAEIQELMDLKNVRSARNLIYKALAFMKTAFALVFACFVS